MTDDDSRKRLTKECNRCAGAGERVEISHPDEGRDVVIGVEAYARIHDGDWEYVGVRECPDCAGYGRVDAKTGEV